MLFSIVWILTRLKVITAAALVIIAARVILHHIRIERRCLVDLVVGIVRYHVVAKISELVIVNGISRFSLLAMQHFLSAGLRLLHIIYLL